ncbi:MAG: hypothetical protein ACREK4_13485 [Candidatus Rokuibacteriota bacterium]
MKTRGAGCVYCGLPRARVRRGGVVATLRACVGHADLLELDPVYALDEATLAAELVATLRDTVRTSTNATTTREARHAGG